MIDDRAELASSFALFHPRYRRALVTLAAFAVAFAVFTYAENAALQMFTASFGRRDAHLWLAHSPIGLLGLFVALRLGKMGCEFAQRTLTARLQDRVRCTIEGEVLARLLRREDGFFANRPPAEILNRLGNDVSRVSERHANVHRRVQASLQAAANLYFFYVQDVRLTVIAVVLTLMGVWVLQKMTGPTTETDRAILAADDRVKATVEDLLRMAPEIQVANLFAKVRPVFERAQRARSTAVLRYNLLYWVSAIVAGGGYLLTLVALFATIAYFVSTSTPALAVALVPVVLKTLPELTANALAFVDAGLAEALATTSMKRLLEYDSLLTPEAGADPAAPVPPAVVSLDGVTHRYATPDGGLQGGIVDVSTTFELGRWTAIAGGAGSGKSTLLQVLLGRLPTQKGVVRYGDRALPSLSAAELARLVTSMPQSVVLLDTTIGHNLAFGRAAEASGADLDSGDLALLDQVGVGAICRLKALDLYPAPEDMTDDLERRVRAARTAIASAYTRAGISARAFHEGGVEPRHWVIERLLGGACPRDVAAHRILERRPGTSLVSSDVGRELVEQGRALVLATSALLGLPSYATYERLAPHPVTERIWEHRRALLVAASDPNPSVGDAWHLLCAALTSSVGELDHEWRPAVDRSRAREDIAALVGDAFVPFDVERIHPHLTWRDNISFVAVRAENKRAEQRAQQTLFDEIHAAALEEAFTRIGLRFEVGRAGARLSGGQRQMISLGRALLRRTPVLVLDEPTSALDPASRARVCGVLREWSRSRVLITISHDPEFIAAADEVRVIAAGRLASSSSVAEELDRGGGSEPPKPMRAAS